MRPLAIALCLYLAAPAWAESIEGRVVGVTDGDTVKVLTAGNVQERIRLAGIDAPERSQPFGQVSKQHLSDQVFERTVTVEWDKRDRYGRLVGKILVAGQDANIEQIRSGLAWHYKKYASEQTPEDRAAYGLAEQEAQEAARGLWSEPAPTAPWDWRHRR